MSVVSDVGLLISEIEVVFLAAVGGRRTCHISHGAQVRLGEISDRTSISTQAVHTVLEARANDHLT